MSQWPWNTTQWQELRRIKLQNYPLCEQCMKQGRLEVATVVDHNVGVSAGGNPFPPLEELTSLCERCHNRKTRVHDQLGQELIDKGCDERGYPLDPRHPFFKGG